LHLLNSPPFFVSLSIYSSPPFSCSYFFFFFFFFTDPATTEIYTLSLHDALPICPSNVPRGRHFKTCASTYTASPARSNMCRLLSGSVTVARNRCGPTGSVLIVAASASCVNARYP